MSQNYEIMQETKSSSWVYILTRVIWIILAQYMAKYIIICHNYAFIWKRDINVSGTKNSKSQTILPLQSFSVFFHHTEIHITARKQIYYSTKDKIAILSANVSSSD